MEEMSKLKSDINMLRDDMNITLPI